MYLCVRLSTSAAEAWRAGLYEKLGVCGFGMSTVDTGLAVTHYSVLFGSDSN